MAVRVQLPRKPGLAGIDSHWIHKVFGFQVFDGYPRKQLGGDEQENE